jgi:integrase
LEDVRLHDLRHSFASVGAAAGLGLPILGSILGHADPATTARYAHLSDDPRRAAAERIAGAASLNDHAAAEVIPFRRP